MEAHHTDLQAWLQQGSLAPGGGDAGPKEQFQDAPGEDNEDSQDFPKVMEDAEQPKEGELGTSKSKGKTSDQPAQATEGAEAPPEETLPVPNPH